MFVQCYGDLAHRSNVVLCRPALHAEVGDVLEVVLKNNLAFPINILPGECGWRPPPPLNPGDVATNRSTQEGTTTSSTSAAAGPASHLASSSSLSSVSFNLAACTAVFTPGRETVNLGHPVAAAELHALDELSLMAACIVPMTDTAVAPPAAAAPAAWLLLLLLLLLPLLTVCHWPRWFVPAGAGPAEGDDTAPPLSSGCNRSNVDPVKDTQVGHTPAAAGLLSHVSHVTCHMPHVTCHRQNRAGRLPGGGGGNTGRGAVACTDGVCG